MSDMLTQLCNQLCGLKEPWLVLVDSTDSLTKKEILGCSWNWKQDLLSTSWVSTSHHQTSGQEVQNYLLVIMAIPTHSMQHACVLPLHYMASVAIQPLVRRLTRPWASFWLSMKVVNDVSCCPIHVHPS